MSLMPKYSACDANTAPVKHIKQLKKATLPRNGG